MPPELWDLYCCGRGNRPDGSPRRRPRRRADVSQAIPPRFTQHLGEQLLTALDLETSDAA